MLTVMQSPPSRMPLTPCHRPSRPIIPYQQHEQLPSLLLSLTPKTCQTTPSSSAPNATSRAHPFSDVLPFHSASHSSRKQSADCHSHNTPCHSPDTSCRTRSPCLPGPSRWLTGCRTSTRGRIQARRRRTCSSWIGSTQRSCCRWRGLRRGGCGRRGSQGSSGCR